MDGNGSAGDDAVEHGIDHVDFIRDHYLLDQVFFPDPFGIVVFCVDVAGRLAHGAVDF